MLLTYKCVYVLEYHTTVRMLQKYPPTCVHTLISQRGARYISVYATSKASYMMMG